MRYLFLSPHPDDVEIACGATMYRLWEEHHEVHIAVVAGPGDLKMVHSGEVVPFDRRMTEQSGAAKTLNVAPMRVHYLNGQPASKFDQESQSVLVTKLDVLFKQFAFDVLVAPLPSYASDHRHVYECAMAATRPGKADYMDVWLYEQPTQFHGEQLCNQLHSRLYMKVTDVQMGKKMAAISMHGSQMNGRPDTIGSLEGATILARLRGLEVGAQYAEMYHLMRAVK